jgi:hypothetical protein
VKLIEEHLAKKKEDKRIRERRMKRVRERRRKQSTKRQNQCPLSFVKQWLRTAAR